MRIAALATLYKRDETKHIRNIYSFKQFLRTTLTHTARHTICSCVHTFDNGAKKKKKKKYNIADTAVKFLDTARLVACPGLATQMQTIKSETRGHTAEIFDLAQVGLSAVQSLMCWPVSVVDGPRPHNTPYQVPFFFPQHSHAPFKLRLELCSLSFLFCTNKLFSLCFKWRPLCFTEIFATPLCNTPQGTF